jgi:hypothetical protein
VAVRGTGFSEFVIKIVNCFNDRQEYLPYTTATARGPEVTEPMT